MSQHHTSGRQGQGSRRRGNNNGNRRYNGNRPYNKGNNRSHREQRAPKLTFWQKLLKAVGLYKPKPAPRKAVEKKTNTRVAKPRNESRVPVPKAPVSNPRLYVGNLSYEATESDLEDLFKGVGSVRSVEVIYNPRTHKSKGYAFIEMQFMDDAVRAVEVLHNQPFMGRLLTVSAANERQEGNPAAEKSVDADVPAGAGLDPDDVPETQNA